MGKNNRIVSPILCALQAMVLAVVYVLLQSTATVGATGTIHIQGTVTNQSGSAVEGVAVSAVDTSNEATVFDGATTAADGTYDLTVEAGTYDVHFVPTSESQLQSAVANGVVVSEDQTVDMQLSPVTHTFSGTVYEANGHVIPNLQVALLDAAGQSVMGVGTTDSDGHFSVVAPAGVYTYLVINDGDMFDGTKVANINLGNAGDVSLDLSTADIAQDITLHLAKLTVSAKDGSGVGASGASFSVASSGGTATMELGGDSLPVAINSANDSGVLDADGLYAGWVVVGATFSSDADSVCVWFQNVLHYCNASTVVMSSDTTVEVNQPLTHTVSGTVTDASGLAVANLQVALLDETGQSAVAVGMTDETGHFSVAAPAGVYTWLVLAGGNAFSDGKLANIDLTNANDDTLDLSTADVTRDYVIDLVRITVVAKDVDGNAMSGAVYSLSALGGGTTSLGINGTPGTITVAATGDSGTVGEDGTYILYVASGTSFTTESGAICMYFVDATSSCTTDPITAMDGIVVTFQEGRAPVVEPAV